MNNLEQDIEKLINAWANHGLCFEPEERLGLRIAARVLKRLLETSEEESVPETPFSDSIASGRQ